MDSPRILIVDDAPENLNILGELLSSEYRISVALNGKDALRIASADDPPDLILLDIMMPGLDGYQVCRRLKEQQKTCHIPVIFVTAMSEHENEERGLTLGAVDYINKPFSPSIIMARVKTHISLYNQTRLLENLVRERTVELEKAKEEAEAANMAKSDFLANISHELRTPLNGILGISQLLIENNTNPDQQDFLQDVLSSSTHMLDLVNALIELSKIDAGKTHLCPKNFQLRDNIKQVLKLYTTQTDCKGLKLNCHFAPELPDTLYGDISHIRQVLMNILDNSLHFTEHGSIDVLIDTLANQNSSANQEGDLTLCFSIKDTGIGIPQHKLSYVLEPFSIGEDHMTKVRSKAGLGLSISKLLVQRMGGKIWLESKEGVGTSASFAIPCGLPRDI